MLFNPPSIGKLYTWSPLTDDNYFIEWTRSDKPSMQVPVNAIFMCIEYDDKNHIWWFVYDSKKLPIEDRHIQFLFEVKTI